MFHWICPECGREIAPTVRECPACDGAEQAELVLAGVVEASARTLQNGSAARLVPPSDALNTRSDQAVDKGRPAVPADPLPEIVKSNGSRLDGPAVQEATVLKPVAAEPIPVPIPRVIDLPRDTSPQEASTKAPIPEIKALTPEILDAKSAFDRATDAKAESIRNILDRATEAFVKQSNSGEGKPVTTRTVESRAVETRPIETRSIVNKLIENKSIESKSLDGKLLESKVVETKNLESQAHRSDARPTAKSKTVEANPAETRQAEIQAVGTKPVATAESVDANVDHAVELQPTAAAIEIPASRTASVRSRPAARQAQPPGTAQDRVVFGNHARSVRS